MFHFKYLYCFILLHFTIAISQLNLHYTDWVSESDNVLQHNCLRVVVHVEERLDVHEIMLYCMSELPSKFMIENDGSSPKLTFNELSKQNITSEDLYRWSTPIDIIEHYQFYLNQLNSALAKQIFYNCTLPRFGSMCQYELPYYRSNYSSLNLIIHDFYRNYGRFSTNLTCYTHLKCNRGLYPSCLDWSEICNGQIDCLDDGIDEEHCWQLEINECKDNEYRCRNGQCVPQSFNQEFSTIPDCVDGSDVRRQKSSRYEHCSSSLEPSFTCEDITCLHKSLSNFQIVLTSSCDLQRGQILREALYSDTNNSLSQDCWPAFKCLIQFLHPASSTCNEFCKKNDCNKIVMNKCPNVLFFPNTPVLFGNVYFAYNKNDLQNRTGSSTIPFYICYNTFHYDESFVNITKIFFNNMTCVNSESFFSPTDFEDNTGKDLQKNFINELYELLARYHLPFDYASAMCNRSNMYQCLNSSKCISIYRLLDNIYDCPHMDDENIIGINHNITEQLKKTYFKCEESNKYIHQSLVRDGSCNCEEIEPHLCEDEDLHLKEIKKNISFQNICDEFTDLLPISVAERNETDETECEQWKCNNLYTHCNDIWNCPHGEDESGCTSHRTLNCSSKHHLCVSPKTNKLMCLSVERANDGNIDCLGAIDERALCGTNVPIKYSTTDDFYCMNRSTPLCISFGYLCDGYKQCKHGEDEQFCTTIKKTSLGFGICLESHYILSDVEQFLCSYHLNSKSYDIIHFKLHGLIESVENTMFSSSSVIKMSSQYRPRCHRGLDLWIWSNIKTSNIKIDACLCPSSYYGDQCQYQNQRISLSIQFQALSDSWRTLFAIIISLIDDSDQRIIHSYEQVTYLSVTDCQRKVNLYLLYSTRPKNPRSNYAIHIDIYEKESLTYRGSLLYPVDFPFLPVYRLSLIVNIPPSDLKTQNCSNDECIHGQCIKYYNNPQNLTFCKCNEGWSGKYCTTKHTCICSSNSSCIGVSPNNRSICVCPINKFGPRCLLNHTICHTNNSFTCQNGGQCFPIDDYIVSNQDFLCICPKGYSGHRCEIVDNKLILSFHEDLLLSQSIFTHFIEIPYINNHYNPHVRATTFQTIPLRQDSVTIYWSRPFHLVFTEFINKLYYLTLVQTMYNRSATITKTITPSDRCPNITELFNQTFLQWHLIRRIKYYHLPCQNQSLNLSCFHDEVHFCLCYDFHGQRLANCFNFDHNMIFDCFGRNECENGGQCLQDNPKCPTKSICICPSCFYGRRCQFSTRGFDLSLDAILGYHIIPDVSLTQQPFIIKISLALTIIVIVIGCIDSILCIITFKNKIVREVGCGLYLLGSSITTLLIMVMFGLKFLILILAQMTIISNRTFLQVQCHSLDFILRVCLNFDQWLNACVAMERVFTIIKGAGFVKKKSKRAAKLVIVILLIVIIGTSIHDPIYRHLIDEENDIDDLKRTWCFVKYPSSLEIYNYIMHSFHFFGPFIINLISSIILITKKSRQQATIHTHQTYKKILRQQFREHKHLLAAPIVLVILALPRLIITFVSKCMKSTNDAWLFLIGYFISFIPSMLTFIIFIVPSKFYKNELRKSLKQYRSTIQRSLHLTS